MGDISFLNYSFDNSPARRFGHAIRNMPGRPKDDPTLVRRAQSFCQSAPKRPSWSYTSRSVPHFVRCSMTSRPADASVLLRNRTGRPDRGGALSAGLSE